MITIKHKSKAKLTLVGAGPGDPELITIKGIKALIEAKVVLYDALVHPDLLEYSNGEKIFVGKRYQQHSFSQDEINLLIVKKALEKGEVVRLKGGDPFVFGRGYEEIEFAKQFGIKSAVVPGISSATGLTALQKIPLTIRGMNESFWVITGTNSLHQLSNDLIQASKTSATIVILMGVSKLKQIVEVFKAIGKEDMPVALIQNGSLKNEKVVLGKIENIQQKVIDNKLSSPAIIVVGENVKLHPSFITQNLKKEIEKHYLLN